MATILVIDDERMICDLLRSVFYSFGHEVLMATSGREGLELFRQRKPRFTLLDLNMPGMNGLEVLQEIRKIDQKADVIILTGGGTDALEIKARGLGAADFLRKGLPLEALVRLVDKAMQRTASVSIAPPSVAAPDEASSGGSGGQSILVVDDEPHIRSLISQFLTTRGYRVRVAEDGPAALTLVEEERPQLIILDINMPGMSGLDVLRQLRAKQYTGGVLALTGSPKERDRQGMLDLGAVHVMEKPVNLEKLELAILLGCALSTA